ncbi:MAG: hypothetical protein R3C42_05035 [Parvularculaceae bacterium]|nr:hypothetical protein [Parvularculaceae bacterium]
MTTRDDNEKDAEAPIDVEATPVEETCAPSAPSEEDRPARRLLMAGGAAAIAAIVLIGVLLVRIELGKEQASRESAASSFNNEEPARQSLEIPAQGSGASASKSPSQDKIFNNAGASLKEGAAQVDAADRSVQGSISELPPPPPAGGSNGDLQSAAKEAAKSLAKPPAEIDLSKPEAALESLEDVAVANSSTSRDPGPYSFPSGVSPDVSTGGDDGSSLSLETQAAMEISRLEGSLAEQREQSARQSLEIARLQDEMARLQKKDAPALRRARAIALFSALEEKARAGAPYRTEYDAYAASGAALAALAGYADAGLPTAAGLRGEFAAPMREALKIAYRAGANGPFGKIGANIAALVKLRPAAPRKGDDAVAVLSRADDAVRRGAVSDALAELAALDGVTRAPFSGWIDRARAFADADNVLADARAALIADSERENL